MKLIAPNKYTSTKTLKWLVLFILFVGIVLNIKIWDSTAVYIVAECPNNEMEFFRNVGWYQSERLKNKGRFPPRYCEVWEYLDIDGKTGEVIRLKRSEGIKL